ncbi:MAG: hypothetical protein RLZZ143_2758, partial [Cyanobacteriota bacterium]
MTEQPTNQNGVPCPECNFTIP